MNVDQPQTVTAPASPDAAASPLESLAVPLVPDPVTLRTPPAIEPSQPAPVTDQELRIASRDRMIASQDKHISDLEAEIERLEASAAPGDWTLPNVSDLVTRCPKERLKDLFNFGAAVRAGVNERWSAP